MNKNVRYVQFHSKGRKLFTYFLCVYDCDTFAIILTCVCVCVYMPKKSPIWKLCIRNLSKTAKKVKVDKWPIVWSCVSSQKLRWKAEKMKKVGGQRLDQILLQKYSYFCCIFNPYFTWIFKYIGYTKYLIYKSRVHVFQGQTPRIGTAWLECWVDMNRMSCSTNIWCSVQRTIPPFKQS